MALNKSSYCLESAFNSTPPVLFDDKVYQRSAVTTLNINDKKDLEMGRHLKLMSAISEKSVSSVTFLPVGLRLQKMVYKSKFSPTVN